MLATYPDGADAPQNDVLTIQFLGTGAADHDWQDPEHPMTRGSTSTLLNDRVLIDAGATGFANLRRAGSDVKKLTDLVVTHIHKDHFSAEAVAEIIRARGGDVPPLKIHVSPGGIRMLEGKLPGSSCEMHPLHRGEKFTAGGLDFTALASNHQVEAPEEETFWFFIETPQGNLLYALDGAWMTTRAANTIVGKHLSWIIWDGTVEKFGDWRMFEHSDLSMLTLQIAGLRARKNVDDRTVHILTHIARTLWQEEGAEARAAARGFLMARDGMKLVFPGMEPDLPPPEFSAEEKKLRLDGFFQSGMVLQQGRSVAVSGYAASLVPVTLTLGEIRLKTIAAADGRFTFSLPPLTAADGLSLTVESPGEKLELHDIAAGEVYLLSGQSNMELHLADASPGPEAIPEEDFKRVRLFKIPHRTLYGRQSSTDGKWTGISRSDAGKVSALGAFFGCEIARACGVTVGLIDASLGGSNIESWISRAGLLSTVYREEMLEYERTVSSEARNPGDGTPDGNQKLSSELAKLFPSIPEDGGEKAGFAGENFDDGAWESMRLPDSWTQAGHNHAGIFWFRRKVTLTEAQAARRAVLHLGAIDKGDRVFCNGRLIGRTGDMLDMAPWNTLRVYPVERGVLHPGENTISVQAGSLVSICTDGGMIGPEEEMYLEFPDSGEKLGLSGMWKYRETHDAGTVGMTFMRTLGPGICNSFHILFDNMIHPLAGVQLRGVVWYQGEANAICTAEQYRVLLNGMVDDWRRHFEDPELPFFIVQLPDFGNPHYFAPFAQWAKVREAQFLSARDRGNDCIVTLGTGDVVNIHPVNKKAVAERVAEAALQRMRGEIPSAGPVPEKLSRRGNALVIRFTGGPLAAKDGSASPGGFVLAGRDGVCFAAKAAITGPDTLELTADGTDEPEAVWYAWAENPAEAGLQDVHGHPASPFRAALDGSLPTGKNLIHRP